MDASWRARALARGLSERWQSEPMLGADYGEEEIAAVVASMRASMEPSVGFGFITDEFEVFEREFAQYCGVGHAVSVCTASVGLEMAIRCLDLQPGEEVICPSVNFVAAPMAVLGHGGKLVLCEVDPRTLCADPADVQRRMTPRTRALLITHMNGLSAPMEEFLTLAARRPHPEHGPPKVIGDAARAAGGAYRGKKIGKAGWMTIFSFHTMKNMSTLGEGGMITTDDPEIVPRLQEMRQFGGEGWGSSYKMTKAQAAVGPVQLRRLDGFIRARRKLAAQRSELLAGCPGLTLPCEPPDCYHSYYMYTMLVPREWEGEKRDRLIARLDDEYRVECRIFNRPVHQTSRFVARHTAGQQLPLSEQLGGRIVCPPMHPSMSEADNEYIAAAIWEAVEQVAAEG